MFFGPDEVQAAQGIRRHPDLAVDVVDETLDHVSGLGPSAPAIRVHRHRVGVVAADARMDRRDVVAAGRHAGAVRRHEGGELGEIGPRDRFEGSTRRPRKPALSVEAISTVGDVVPALASRRRSARVRSRAISRAAADAPPRPAQSAYSRTRKALSRNRRPHPGVITRTRSRFTFEHVARRGCHGSRWLPLAAERQGVALARHSSYSPIQAARLEIVRDEPVVHHREPHRPGGLGEGLTGLRASPKLRVGKRGSAAGLGHTNGPSAPASVTPIWGWERLHSIAMASARFPRLSLGLGDHEGDRVAHVPDRVFAENRIRLASPC
jgi:hypothetical protein